MIGANDDSKLTHNSWFIHALIFKIIIPDKKRDCWSQGHPAMSPNPISAAGSIRFKPCLNLQTSYTIFLPMVSHWHDMPYSIGGWNTLWLSVPFYSNVGRLEGFWLNLLIGSNFAGQYSGKIKRVSLYVVINNEEDGHGRRLSIRTCQSLGAINKRLWLCMALKPRKLWSCKSPAAVARLELFGGKSGVKTRVGWGPKISKRLRITCLLDYLL